jgi:hypothetical protein
VEADEVGVNRYEEAAATLLAETGVSVKKYRTSSSGTAFFVGDQIECPKPRGAISFAIPMPDARFRVLSSSEHFGPICPDCAGRKRTTPAAAGLLEENVLRDDAYWARRACPDCSGPKARNGARCRPCTNALMRGKPRSTPVVVAAGHKWRRMRFGKAAA